MLSKTTHYLSVDVLINCLIKTKTVHTRLMEGESENIIYLSYLKDRHFLNVRSLTKYSKPPVVKETLRLILLSVKVVFFI